MGHRLASDGIVSKRKGQGWTFHPTLDTAKSQRESYEFRKLLEPGAIRCPNFFVPPDRLLAMRQEHVRLIAWATEHLEILGALERNRRELAATLMLEHIVAAERETLGPG